MIKKRFISMLVLLCLTVSGAWAQNPSWVRGDDTWDGATKTLTVNTDPEQNAYAGNVAIEHVIIANTVTSIHLAAFANCSNLTSVSIPSSVAYIDENAFAYTGLTSVTIPGNEEEGTKIIEFAFEGCENLTTVTLGNGGGKINMNVFKGCTSLTTVIVYAQSAGTWVVEAGIFGNPYNDELKIYVPSYLVDDFKGAAGWSVFSDIIEPITYKVSVKEGTEDATSWQGKAGEGNYQALPLEGVALGTAVTVKYNGTKKVKSVKYKKTAATVTTAPTAKTGVKVGQNEAIVNAGTAEGGTMMYMLNATQPTSTDGFSATVPTAEGLTAGTYYVWYYVKADDSHTDSEISATGIEVTIAAKAAAEATAEDKGKVIGTDGKIYADVAAATAAATTAVAKIIYIGTTGHATYTHGLALALTDEEKKAWESAIDACSAKNSSTPVTNATWLLASKDQWNYMVGTDGAGSHTALRDGFSGITGASNMQSDYYWSSTPWFTEYYSEKAWFFGFNDSDGAWYAGKKDNAHCVRACLVF